MRAKLLSGSNDSLEKSVMIPRCRSLRYSRSDEIRSSRRAAIDG